MRQYVNLRLFSADSAPGREPVLLARIPLGQAPSLHPLRNRATGLVRWLLRYYSPVRLPMAVHRCRAPYGFTARTVANLHGQPRDLPGSVQGVSVRAAGSPTARDSRASRANDACDVAFRLPRQRRRPEVSSISRLNTQPARYPVNASPLPSRTTTHDSGLTWFATPSLGGTCTRETYRFVPAHRRVKIFMRLPDGMVETEQPAKPFTALNGAL